MFENILNFLDELDGEFTYTAEVETDNEGYTDRECPREECMSKFKILEEDWVERIVSNLGEEILNLIKSHQA